MKNDDLEDKKVYFPVESLVGLGHFNRTGKLVREMVEAGLDVTVASGTFVDPDRFFKGARHKEMQPYVFRRGKTNEYFSLNADGKRTIVSEFNAAAIKDQRVERHAKNISSLKPDVLISEFWPFDRPTLDNEMIKALEAAKQANENVLRVVSVRDVLDTPQEEPRTEEEIRAYQDRKKWVIETINNSFDAVLVHGDPKFIPLKETFPEIDQIRVPIIYTGYVIDDLPERTAASSSPDAPIVVSCGSGVDGDDMIFSFLTSWQLLLKQRDEDTEIAAMTSHPLTIVCGPRFFGQSYADVKDWADMLQEKYGANITVEKYRDDLTTLLANAAFSVSLAGYNTTLETMAIGVPSLLIPKYAYVDGMMRMSTEQLYRLERLQEDDFVRYVRPEDVEDPATFAQVLVGEFVDQTTNAKQKAQLDFMGADNAVIALAQLLEKKQGSGQEKSFSFGGFKPIFQPAT